MQVELDKTALVSLVMGTQPDYSIMDNPFLRIVGSFNDNRGWKWNKGDLKKASDEQLLALYVLCRMSWKDAKVMPNSSS